MSCYARVTCCVLCPATTAAMCARGARSAHTSGERGKREEDGRQEGSRRSGGSGGWGGKPAGGWCAERCSVAMEPPGTNSTYNFTPREPQTPARVERGRCGWSCHGGHSSPPCHGRVPVPPSSAFTRAIGDDYSSAAGPLETIRHKYNIHCRVVKARDAYSTTTPINQEL